MSYQDEGEAMLHAGADQYALVCSPAAHDKPYEQLRAVAAMAGFRVHRLDAGGGFVVVGANGWCTPELRDLNALAQRLLAMGVAT